MERRRGTLTLWLLAAGSLALVGCRTPTGSEESSSWFNFSPRRGGQGGGSAAGKQPVSKPRTNPTDRLAEKPPEPTPAPPKATEPPLATRETAVKKASPSPAAADATPPSLAEPTPQPRRIPADLAADATPGPRAPAPSLGLPSLPAGRETGRPAPPIAFDLPEGSRPKSPAPTALAIAPAEGSTTPRSGTALSLPEPSATNGRRPPNASLRLPGFGETEATSPAHPRLRLPELDVPTASGETRPTLSLPSGDAPEKRGANAPTLPVPTLDGARRERTGESPGLPGVAERAPTAGTRGGPSLGVEGILPAAGAPKSLAHALTLPATDVGPRPDAEAGVGRMLPTGEDPMRGRTPAEALRIGVEAGATPPVNPGSGPGWSAGQPSERAGRPPAEARGLPPFAPATDPTAAGGRALRAQAPEAKPTVATVPLPFRLSAWISDEETHRRWREEQLDRAGAEEKARQAEQERLRQALLRFLGPTTPTQ
jgi:hypothetical protein